MGRPGFTIVAVATLGLGIGATAAIFSVVNAVLLRPLPYASPDRLVAVWETHPQRSTRSLVTPANYMDWRDRVTTIAELEAYRDDFSAALTGEGEPVEAAVAQVTPGLFGLLGVRPMLGRGFESLADSSAAGSDVRVVLMSHALWRTRFGGDSGVIGRVLTVDAQAVEVIGVLPPDVAVPSRETDFWAPMRLGETARQQRTTHMYAVVGRLREGASVEAAQAEMRSVSATIVAQHPDVMDGWSARVTSLHADIVRDARSPLLLLLGAVGFVLLIACTNVSNLLLVRGVGREREIAVRSALGAGRARLVRQLLAESLLLALAGGALALALAFPSVRLLVHFAPAGMPLIEDTRISLPVLGFAMLVTMATTIVFGSLPALRASRPRMERALGEIRARGQGRRHARVQGALVVAEVALSMLLVAGAGLLFRSMSRLREADPGFEMAGLLDVSLYLPMARYDTDVRQVAFFDALLGRLRNQPGIEAAAGTSEPPVVGFGMTFSIEVEGRPDAFDGTRSDHLLRAVTDDWFTTTGIPVRGRGFTSTDRRDGARVAIINEAMARQVWPGEDAMGKRLRPSVQDGWFEIVGIAGDTRHFGLDRVEGPVIYIPWSQKPWTWLSWMSVMVRTNGEPMDALPAIQREVWTLDPDLPIQRAVPVTSLYADNLASRRFTTALLGIFAALALTLGIVGLYGVIAFSVAERSREIGVRLALGASPSRVIKAILTDGLVLALAGIGIGLVAAILMRATIRGLLFDTRPLEPLTLAAAALLLVAGASAATIVPALRAVRIQPASTLRSD